MPDGCADVQRHADAFAGVEPRAAHLGEFPAGAQVAGAPFGVGLEAAAGQHHGLGADIAGAAALPDADAPDAVVVRDQLPRRRAELDRHALGAGEPVERVHKTWTAAPGLDGQPAPELEAAVDAIGLAAPDRHEAHALALHPAHRRAAAGDQQFAELRVGPILGDPAHVVEELAFGVGSEIGVGDFAVGEVGHQRPKILDAVVGAAERAGGEAAVAAALDLRRPLQHQHVGAGVGGRQRRAQAPHCPRRRR